MAVLAGWATAPRRMPVRRTARPMVRPGGLAPARMPVPAVTACRRAVARRRVVGLLAGALLVTGLALGLSALLAGAGDAVPERTTVVQVAPGETLWQLAERVAPGSPPQQVVERIRRLNGMHGSTIHPGQPLIVPDGGAVGVADTPR